MPADSSIETTRLFGTDGVRGKAGVYPLDPATVRRLGAALVRALPQKDGQSSILVGRDTRESGVWIEQELAGGAAGEGAAVTSVGIVPTPAVAYLAREQGFDAGVVISASHNPFEDNGIKVFSGSGEKFTERVEREVEAIVADVSWSAQPAPAEPTRRPELVGAYLEHLRAILPESMRVPQMPVALDTANGATTPVAEALFRSLGFSTVTIGNTPDGRNINLNCGSTHPHQLSRTVVNRGCQLGVAFDGDGDRAIFADEHGRIVDGDAVLLMCARQLQREGRLKGDAVVATVMSNIGLEIALRESGIDLVRCAVGDKYVMQEMLARNLSLGGEQSGHVIFSDYLFTGDGLCTALNVLRTMALTRRTLSELAGDLVTYPQVLLNARVREKVDLATVPAISSVIDRVETAVAGQGRLLVRYSGTEPLLRVMLEGRREDEIRTWAQDIIDVVREHLGE
jgi:phosphoglucosamine mutase